MINVLFLCIGIFIGLLAKTERSAIIKDIEQPKMINGKAQFIEPVEVGEKLKKSKTIGDFIDKL